MSPNHALRPGMLELADQHVAELRRQAPARATIVARPRPLRAATGRALVRLGERLAAPARTATCP